MTNQPGVNYAHNNTKQIERLIRDALSARQREVLLLLGRAKPVIVRCSLPEAVCDPEESMRKLMVRASRLQSWSEAGSLNELILQRLSCVGQAATLSDLRMVDVWNFYYETLRSQKLVRDSMFAQFIAMYAYILDRVLG